MEKISLKIAALYWLKLGLTSFGGPTGQISMMYEELVEKRKWIPEKKFLNALNFSMLLPGPEAQQLATYLGWYLHGRLGGLISGILFILPSFIFLVILSYLYINFAENYVVESILYGVRAAVIAIIFSASINLAKKVLNQYYLWIIPIFAVTGINYFDLNYFLIIFLAGLSGFLYYRFHIKKIETNVNKNISNQALVSLKTIFFGFLIWAFVLIFILTSSNTLLIDMSLFFSKASLITFGGAYSVLPYVYQNVIESYGWLNEKQMLDGLALGESTPGPLIMIVTYVGYFVGEVNNSMSGSGLILMPIFFAFVATFFMFLPSFIFVFAGAPLIEKLQGIKAIDFILSFITAAIIGLIVNLGVFLAYKTIYNLDNEIIDYNLLILSVLCFLALYKQKVGVIPLIITAGFTGYIIKNLF
tara:strand:- start:1065 stop:2312 length:1248 start_codon:yes stop_codon:yes gene_type:complete